MELYDAATAGGFADDGGAGEGGGGWFDDGGAASSSSAAAAAAAAGGAKAKKKVSLVGYVQDQKATATHVAYSLEDSTGEVIAQAFTSDSPDLEEHKFDDLRGSYVKVVGRVQSTESGPFAPAEAKIQTLSIRPLTDHNEITYHSLAAIQAFLRATLGKREARPEELKMPSYSYPTSQSSSAPAAAASSQMYSAAGYDPSQWGAPSSYTQPNPSHARATYQSIQAQSQGRMLEVYNAFSNHPGNVSELGVPIAEIQARLQMPKDEFDRILETLASEGQMYAAGSSDYYKTT